MNSKTIFLVGVLSISLPVLLQTEQRAYAQEADEDLAGEDEEDGKKREQESLDAERKQKEEEQRRSTEEANRAAVKQQLKERKAQEEKERELNALREKAADTTEYTLSPNSVELVVEMDPNGYGFRTRAHRMSMSGEFDFLLRGRTVLHYDYRFFNYLSVGVLLGCDWSSLSLFSRFSDNLSKLALRQFSILGGVSAKWRLTEWYMRSSIFLEPSLMFGHMWQSLKSNETTHWRFRPGLFAGVESVFDSGLATTARLGVEFPLDFGSANAWRDGAEPLFLVGLGLAI